MSDTIHITAEESPTTVIVEAVADETGRDPHELPTLYQVVDPDALNCIVGGSRLGESNVSVTFAMAGCSVRVTDTGEVTVEQTEEVGAHPDTAQAGTPGGDAGTAGGEVGPVESPTGSLAFERSR